MAGLGEITSSSPIVSLNNWKRLSNALLELPQLSAVYWRDFIIVMDVADFASDRGTVRSQVGECLLYNIKWNMWSKQPTFPERPTYGSPLVCFKNRLLALGSSGTLYEFHPEMSRWEKSEAFKVQLSITPTGPSGGGVYRTRNGQPITTTLLSAYLLSSQTSLFLIYTVNETLKYRQTQQQAMYFRAADPGPTSTQRVLLEMYNGSLWSNPSSLNLGQEQLPVLSVALHHQSQTVYMNTDKAMFSIEVSPPESVESNQSTELTTTTTLGKVSLAAEAKLDMKSHAAPPLKMSTLSIIDDCLFAFGGKDQDNQPFASVHYYSPETDSWQEVGSMLSSRYGVAVTTVNRDQEDGSDVYVIGGYLGESSQVKIGCRIIECCSVSVSRGD